MKRINNKLACAMSREIDSDSATNNAPTITETVLVSVPMLNVFSLKKQLPIAQMTAVINEAVIPIETKIDKLPENNKAPCEMA
jgi:hypothetical protein